MVPEGGNGRCNGLNLQATPSGVWRPMVPYHCTSDRGGISSLALSINKRGRRDSKLGGRLPARPHR
jgi:hypothetical protein